jgi:hypothetical protein
MRFRGLAFAKETRAHDAIGAQNLGSESFRGRWTCSVFGCGVRNWGKKEKCAYQRQEVLVFFSMLFSRHKEMMMCSKVVVVGRAHEKSKKRQSKGCR